MNFKHVFIVLKKELNDMSRDKRTIISSILLPMIIIPLLYYFMGSSASNFDKNVQENLTVAVSNTENKAQIEDYLRKNLFTDMNNVKILELDNPMQSLKDGNVRVVIDVDQDYLTKISGNLPFEISLSYDSSKMTSSSSIDILTAKVQGLNAKISLNRLSALGVDPNIMNPTILKTIDVAPKESQNNQMLSMLLPMLLSMLLATSGAPAAIDLIVGERERKTFESLLTTKASRFSILVGKYLAISVFSMISVITSLVGVIIGMKLSPGMFGKNVGMSFNLSPVTLIMTILVILVFGFMFSAIQIAISAFAKTVKEGQTYTSFLVFLVMIPAYATMFMQAGDIQTYMSFIPVLNVIGLLKMVISGMINNTYLVFTLIASIFYFVIILFVTFNMFKKENIVIR